MSLAVSNSGVNAADIWTPPATTEGDSPAMGRFRPTCTGLPSAFSEVPLRNLHVARHACNDGQVCGTPPALRRQQAALWAVAAGVGLLIGNPWYAPYPIAGAKGGGQRQ